MPKKGALLNLREFEKSFNVDLELPEEENNDKPYRNLEKEIEEEIELPLQNILLNQKKDTQNSCRVFVLNFLINERVKE